MAESWNTDLKSCSILIRDSDTKCLRIQKPMAQWQLPSTSCFLHFFLSKGLFSLRQMVKRTVWEKPSDARLTHVRHDPGTLVNLIILKHFMNGWPWHFETMITVVPLVGSKNHGFERTVSNWVLACQATSGTRVGTWMTGKNGWRLTKRWRHLSKAIKIRTCFVHPTFFSDWFVYPSILLCSKLLKMITWTKITAQSELHLQGIEFIEGQQGDVTRKIHCSHIILRFECGSQTSDQSHNQISNGLNVVTTCQFSKKCTSKLCDFSPREPNINSADMARQHRSTKSSLGPAQKWPKHVWSLELFV